MKSTIIHPFLSILLISGLLTWSCDAARTSDEYKQYTKHQDKYSHHKGYGKPDDPSRYKPSHEPSYEEQYHAPSYESQDYGKAVAEHWCFQEVTREPYRDAAKQSTFQCCDPNAVDVCLHSSTDPERGYQGNSDTELMDVLNPSTVATCVWGSMDGICPENSLDSCLAVGTLNCSMTSAAAACGCSRAVSFRAKGYFVAEPAASCEESYDVLPQPDRRYGISPNITGQVHIGTAWIFKGEFKLRDSNGYDYKVAKGYLQFIPTFGQVPVNAVPGRRLLSTPPAASKKPASADKASASYVTEPEDTNMPPEMFELVKGGSLNVVLFEEEY